MASRQVATGLGALLALTGCGLSSGSSANASGGRIAVVAAENFWGSIAAQLGGEHVHVTSVIVNPATDPHAYEAKPDDARAIAQARYVIVNGAGYDPWAPKLLEANPVSGRVVLTVADLVGKREGDNPHLWYSPAYVDQVIDRITRDLDRLDPADATYFDQQKSRYKSVGLEDYNAAIEAIRRQYSGTPVGATETIFSYTAAATGLKLVTPPGYMKAVSEGSDTSAADKATIEQQIMHRQIRVLIFNAQNTTPEVSALLDRARAAGIPVTSVTETLSPPNATFQDWQARQLRALLAALGG